MSNKDKFVPTKEGAKPTLVPSLRFPEFRRAEGWKETALNLIADPLTERAVKGEEGNVLSLSVEHGIVLQKEFFGKKVAGDNSERYLKIARNDFVYNDRTTKASTFGTIKRLSKHSDGIVSPIYKCFRFRDGENPVFWEWFFESGIHNKALAGLVNEGARAGRFNISITQFLSTSAWRPDEREQQKIAECLSTIDEVIAAQARKVDTLKAHKKGLMQQLFPREGETRPRLRFPEFQNAEEWVQKTVGDVSEVLMCKRIFAEETNAKEGVPFYKIGTLGGVPDAFISKEKFEDYKSRYNYPRKGEVLITCSGTVGKCLPFDGKDAYFQDSNIVWLDNPTSEVSNGFLLLLLSNANWGGLNSTTITRIYGPDLRGLAIKYPEDEAEQERIVTCLSSLDTRITAETQKVEALKLHKGGLMRKLFPSQEVEA